MRKKELKKVSKSLKKSVPFTEETLIARGTIKEKDDQKVWSSGLTKLVFFNNEENKVYKIPFNSFEDWDKVEKCVFYPIKNRWGWNHIEREEEIYTLATKWGLKEIFLENRKINSDREYPVYEQDMIKRSARDFDSTRQEYERVQEIYNWAGCKLDINEHWLCDVIDEYGEDVTMELINFIATFQITDLHSGNLGYNREGKPVILDYGGYHSVEKER